MAYSPDGGVLVSASADRSLRVWDAAGRAAGRGRACLAVVDGAHSLSVRVAGGPVRTCAFVFVC